MDRDRASSGAASHRLAVILALLLATGCGEEFEGYTPSVDSSLAGPIDPEQLDFESSEPALVAQHDTDLLRRFAGRGIHLGPGEGFPRSWSQSCAWSAGELSSADFEFRYVRVPPFVFCLGKVHEKLGWSSSAAPDETHWVEEHLVPLRTAHWTRFDAARIDDTLVLVRDGEDGLHEVHFGIEGGALVERSRRLLSAVGEDPMLLEVGPDLLFFWWEPTLENERWQGGRALRVARWAQGSGGWSEPDTLTVEGTHAAAARRGDQVAVAWPDNRFSRIEGLGLGRTRKLFVATSLDRGKSWSTPRCVQDPASRDSIDGEITLLPFGERWLLLAPSSVFPKPDGWGDTLVLSSDLGRWMWLPGEHRNELVNAAVVRLTHD